MVTLPKNKRIVGCRWVYTVKYNSDGSLERYKAKLVAKGYTQPYDIDYVETFALLAKLDTVKILIALAINLELELNQYDVKNAFLHGEIKEEIYMEPPPYYYSTLLDMKNLRYNHRNRDHTLFLKHSRSRGVTLLLVYVDDIIISENDKDELKALSQQLSNQFEIKSLEKLKYFLQIKAAYSEKGIFFSQQKYVLDLLKETWKIECKPINTPIDPNSTLGLVGQFIYLHHTRPDIAFAVGIISQFIHDPREPHLQAVHKILSYLKGTTGQGILFQKA
ncbi:unnamed protein product [Spirodela intermedia]|uniref:Reverse transcriptase Ty1/copia-type domain-containing protein n=1 Tax=Spirodela intermedia TaxID=51605 RepID=A0A7I8L648_SPIIN|nr:unnamed protein product [Spirodela intermedia]